MQYSKLAEVYESLSKTTKGLEKKTLIANFLKKIKNEPEIIYLLQGRFFPDYDERESGISEQLAIKAIAKATGIKESVVVSEFRKLGDLGKVAELLLAKKKQSSLFSSKLTTQKVLESLRKLPELEGKGTVEKKMNIIIELLHASSPIEAKYIIRTLLNDLKIGLGSGILRDSIAESCFSPKDIEEKRQKANLIQNAYDKATDFAEVFSLALKGEKALSSVSLSPGKPVKVMLYPKAKDIKDAFEIVGKPAAFEYKYDGFRMMINKSDDEKISIFTRRLDNVTKQFQDAVKYVKEHVNAKTFIIDCEAVGYDPKTKKYKPFQDISQRKKIEKIIKPSAFQIRLAEQIITDSYEKAESFYEKALEDGQEGLMAKNLEAIYKPGARIGYAVKIKPNPEEFDLVITGAEYGTGKRAGWITSFDLSCKTKEGKLLEIGKASTGLKEKPEEGLSFVELTKELKKLIMSEEGKHVQVKPEMVVSIGYQNIQESPSYTSGFALRFPRILRLRPDRDIN